MPYIWYNSITDYDTAVLSHIQNMLEIHEAAIEANQQYQSKMKDYTDGKRIGQKVVQDFYLNERVWFNIARRHPELKFGRVKWIGPCRII